jgi:thymidylate kinase
MTSVQHAERRDMPAGMPLPCVAAVAALLRQLHENAIQYCHWKSNEHLAASLAGETDLDILVSRENVQDLARVLAASGFKRCLTARFRDYPAIESYLGLDEETGRLIHLHLHYQLTVGERYLKGYRLPWEHHMLSSRLFSEREGVYVADPNLELLLLVVRSALKLRWRDLVHLRRPAFAPQTLRELRWLRARIDRERLNTLAASLLGKESLQHVSPLIEDLQPTLHVLYRFRRCIAGGLDEHRTYSAVEARWRRWCREALARRAGRRQLPQGGIIIAVVGADGSGKSTVTTELARWLGRHLDTGRIYFGSGQGPASFPRRALEMGASLVKRTSRSARAASQSARRGHSSSRLRMFGDLLWVTALSMERRRRATQARRARNRGVVVLCDRYPQSQHGANDGPTMRHCLDHRSRLRRTVARRELESLRYAERVRPDLVLKLKVAPDIALQRKPETPPALLYTKLRVLEQLDFPVGTQVCEIDATRPLEQVLLEVKREVWRAL